MAAPFILLSLSFLLKGVWENDKYIKISYFFIFCAMQMHLSASLLLIIIIFFSIVIKISIKEIFYILLFFVLNFGFYIVHEINNNFLNSAFLIYQLKELLVNYKLILLVLLSFFGIYFISIKKAIQLCLIIIFLLLISIITNSSSYNNTNIENEILLKLTSSSQINNLCNTNKNFKCVKVNNSFSNLNMINLNEVREVISKQLNSYHKDYNYTYVNIDNTWENSENKYSKLHMVVFIKDKKIIYTEDGYLRPLWNIENVKEVLSISYMDLKINFIILTLIYLFFIVKFYSNKEFQDIYFICLCGLIIDMLVFGGTFSFMLSDGHKRYLLLNLMCHLFVIVLLVNKYKVNFLISNKNKYFILFLLLFMIFIVVKKDDYIINKTEELINKISKISGYNNYDIYNNLILINKDKEIVLTNRTVDYKYKKNTPNKNICYMASQVKLSLNQIEDIYSQPYNMCIGEECLANKKNKSKYLSFNGNKLGLKDNSIKVTSIKSFGYVKNKFNNNNYYIYASKFKDELSCPSSYHNRYMLSNDDVKEKNLYDMNTNNITYKNHFIFKNKTYNGQFIYSLIIDKKNGNILISSNQLKGISYNSGFFNSYSMYNIQLTINGKVIKLNNILGINGNIKPLTIKNNSILKLNKGDIIDIKYNIKMVSFFSSNSDDNSVLSFNNKVTYN